MTKIFDDGKNDPLEFDLGAWECVAKAAKADLEAQLHHKLTDVTADEFKERIL